MLARIHRLLCAGGLVTAGVIACAPATSSAVRETRYSGSTVPMTATSRFIGADRIQRSGSQSALDAIRALVPGYRSLESRGSATGWPGITSARGALRVLVDGHPIGDLETLRMVPAQNILGIHVLNAADAMMRFGPGFNGGVIVIQTVATLRRL